LEPVHSKATGQRKQSPPQDELKANLKSRGLICIDGIGKHPINNWPGEIIFLALGLGLEAAKSLARHCEQNAFMWAASKGSV
jgi:hypothetical protein